MKRITALTLALLLVLFTASCGDKKTTSSVGASDASGVSSQTESAVSAKQSIVTIVTDATEYDTLPEMLRLYLKDSDYGETVNFRSTNATKYIPTAPTAVPVTLNWKYTDDSSIIKSTTLLVSRNKDLSNPQKYEFGDPTQDSCNVYNLCNGVQYYWQVCVTLNSGEEHKSEIASFSVKEGVRILKVNGVYNMRDVGGWKGTNSVAIKQGLLYRCAKLDGITDAGKATMLETLGIKTEIDLRKANEISSDSVIPQFGMLGKTVKYVQVPAYWYSTFFTDIDETPKIFNTLANYDNYPIVFHCVAGADRTGATALAVEALCGVSEADVTRDYEITPDRDRTYNGFGDMMKMIKKQHGNTFKDKMYNLLHDTCRVSAMALSNIYNIMMTDSALFKSNSIEVKSVNAGANVSFDIDLRSSGGIKSVTLNGSKISYTFKNGTLTVKAPNTSATKASGVITFNDGATLNFDTKTN